MVETPLERKIRFLGYKEKFEEGKVSREKQELKTFNIMEAREQQRMGTVGTSLKFERGMRYIKDKKGKKRGELPPQIPMWNKPYGMNAKGKASIAPQNRLYPTAIRPDRLYQAQKNAWKDKHGFNEISKKIMGLIDKQNWEGGRKGQKEKPKPKGVPLWHREMVADEKLKEEKKEQEEINKRLERQLKDNQHLLQQQAIKLGQEPHREAPQDRRWTYGIGEGEGEGEGFLGTSEDTEEGGSVKISVKKEFTKEQRETYERGKKQLENLQKARDARKAKALEKKEQLEAQARQQAEQAYGSESEKSSLPTPPSSAISEQSVSSGGGGRASHSASSRRYSTSAEEVSSSRSSGTTSKSRGTSADEGGYSEGDWKSATSSQREEERQLQEAVDERLRERLERESSSSSSF